MYEVVVWSVASKSAETSATVRADQVAASTLLLFVAANKPANANDVPKIILFNFMFKYSPYKNTAC